MVRDIDVKIRFAYIQLKRKLQVMFALWVLALLAGATLILASLFLNIGALKVWSALLAVMLVIKVAYDVGKGMHREYDSFKIEHPEIKSIL